MRAIIFGLLLCAGVALRADVVNLANGDRFIGSVELVNDKEVHVKSEIAGTIKMPRDKVTSIYFGTNQPALEIGQVPALKAPAAKTAIDPKAVDEVQKQFLAGAGPEANAMFTELVQGLASGKVSVDDIREQARQSLAELKELQAELGEDEDFAMLTSYAGILEKFINAGSTNRAKAIAPKPAPKPKAEADEE